VLMMPPGTASNSGVTTASRFRVIGGLALLIAGLIMAALVILSDLFMWARRALERVRRRACRIGLSVPGQAGMTVSARRGIWAPLAGIRRQSEWNPRL
jgi:hypothetical protein